MKQIILYVLMILGSMTAFALESKVEYQAADQSLFVMPTAYTMPRGMKALTDYELIVLQYAYAVNDHTHISAMTLFPITEEMVRTFSVGIKQNYLHQGKIQSAFWTTYTVHFHVMSIGNVVSYGTPDNSFHIAGSWATDFESSSNNVALAIGTIQKLASRTAFIGEFVTASQVLEKETNGLLLFGVRFKGDKMSWDFGGFRPLQGDTGELIALPFLKATFAF